MLSRAFRILGAFRATSEMSLTEIARGVHLPKTTTHRLLAALVGLGAVERTANGYRLGVRMFELGGRVARTTELREAALPFMEDLFEVTHETVHLAVLEGTEALYVERIRGHRQQRQLSSRVGGRLPAYSTAVGKALLAFTPDAAAEVITGGHLVARTRYTITVPRLLLEELATIRATGVALDREENAIGIYCVAAPVFVGRTVAAAISVTGPAPYISAEGVGGAVRTAALGIQRALTQGLP